MDPELFRHILNYMRDCNYEFPQDEISLDYFVFEAEISLEPSKRAGVKRPRAFNSSTTDPLLK